MVTGVNNSGEDTKKLDMPDNLAQQISDKLEGIADVIAVFSSKKEILLGGKDCTVW